MKKYLAPAAVALCAFGNANAGLVVTADTNANNLANSILGAGVSISNAAYSGDTGSTGSGHFTGGLSAGVGFDTGILLTTGSVNNAPGPNNTSSATGEGTFSQLDFDFTLNSGNSLFFNYVFASEEYNEYVGTEFNDFFNLYVDNVNIALVPGNNGEVTINNVNLGFNSTYYRNNDPGPYNIQYDGLTTVLTASATGLSAGQGKFALIINHFKNKELY